MIPPWLSLFEREIALARERNDALLLGWDKAAELCRALRAAEARAGRLSSAIDSYLNGWDDIMALAEALDEVGSE